MANEKFEERRDEWRLIVFLLSPNQDIQIFTRHNTHCDCVSKHKLNTAENITPN